MASRRSLAGLNTSTVVLSAGTLRMAATLNEQTGDLASFGDQNRSAT